MGLYDVIDNFYVSTDGYGYKQFFHSEKKYPNPTNVLELELHLRELSGIAADVEVSHGDRKTALERMNRLLGVDYSFEILTGVEKQIEETASSEFECIEQTLYSPMIHDVVIIKSYKGKSANVRIPKYINGNSVQVIGNTAFNNCLALKSIIIPETVKTIYETAFNGCFSLESIIYNGEKYELDNNKLPEELKQAVYIDTSMNYLYF